ncbi:MAG: class I SAM-dependent methyltransferase [Candidatus Paceibacterota bacterium]|jgi:SAM-dependent methyltransferase
MDLKETYNKIAEDWFKDHKNDDWWVEGTNKFVSLLKPNLSILDVGCGAGLKSKYLSEKGLGVTGIDISNKLIEIAKREVPDVLFYVMDMNDIENLHMKFDGVFAQASLLHIPKNNIFEVITKLISVINDAGFLYIGVKGIDASGKEEDVLKENDYGYDYERFFSYYRMEELEKYLKDLNLNIIYKNSSRVGKTDWLQIIGQKRIFVG